MLSYFYFIRNKKNVKRLRYKDATQQKTQKPIFMDHSPSSMDVYHGSKLLKQQEPHILGSQSIFDGCVSWF